MNNIEQKRGRPRKNVTRLDKEQIIRTAKQMMIEKGNVPSIRAIAKALNVDPMALYYYFDNKNVLLEAITISLISSIYLPVKDENWQQALINLAKSYLEILNKYDGLLHTLLSMTSDSPADIFIERFNLVIEPLTLSETQKKNFLDLVADYLHGFSIALTCDNSNTLSLNDIEQPLCFLFHGVEHLSHS